MPGTSQEEAAMPPRPAYRWPCQPKLKAAIFADGRTTTEIAEAAGLSAVTISAACTGRTRLTPNIIERLARALAVDPADLTDDEQVSA
jgi:transcriptional regulator with XRE-family HTH domain